MPGSFFCDVLKDFNDRYSKPFLGSVPLSLEVKTKPGKGVEIKHGFKVFQDVQKSEDKNDTSVRVGGNRLASYTEVERETDHYHSNFRIEEDSLELSADVKPHAANKDGQILELKHESKYTPSDKLYQMTNSLKFGSKELGPARVFMCLGMQWNSNQEKLLRNALNIRIHDDIHVGYALTHNLEGLKSLLVQAAMVNKEKGTFFLKADVPKKLYSLGVAHTLMRDDVLVQVQADYDATKATEGLFGQPLTVKAVTEVEFSKNTTFLMKETFGKEFVVETSLKQKINDHLTVKASDHSKPLEFLKDGNGQIYFGLQFILDL